MMEIVATNVAVSRPPNRLHHCRRQLNILLFKECRKAQVNFIMEQAYQAYQKSIEVNNLDVEILLHFICQ